MRWQETINEDSESRCGIARDGLRRSPTGDSTKPVKFLRQDGRVEFDAHYIVTALDSVISQSYQNIELIIVDDVSTDNSVWVIENWIQNYNGPVKIRFIKNTINMGLTKVCNLILKNARGKYFQPMDADDWLLPQKIEKQVRILEGTRNTALVYSNIGIIDESGNIIDNDYLQSIGYNKNNMPQGSIFEDLLCFDFIPLPSVLVKTDLARIVGGFDETTQLQDYYLWLKLAEKFEIVYQHENTAFYRKHAGSMTGNSATNPACVDSVLYIRFQYYKYANRRVQKIIRNDIHWAAGYLYRFKYATARTWLKKDLILNTGFKSAIYYAAINLGIPYVFFEKLKSFLGVAKRR